MKPEHSDTPLQQEVVEQDLPEQEQSEMEQQVSPVIQRVSSQD